MKLPTNARVSLSLVNGYPRELDDIEANAIRKELVEIRNRTNKIIDQLDNRPSHRQDTKGKVSGTKADRRRQCTPLLFLCVYNLRYLGTHKTSELVNGTGESHHESRQAVGSPTPIPPAAGLFKESREFDPLAQQRAEELHRSVEEPNESQLQPRLVFFII